MDEAFNFATPTALLYFLKEILLALYFDTLIQWYIYTITTGAAYFRERGIEGGNNKWLI